VTRSSGKRWRLFRFLADEWVWGLFLPTRGGIAALVAGIPVIGLGFAAGAGWSFFWIYNILLAAISIVDIAMLPSKKRLRAERTIPGRVEHKRAFDIGIRISHDGNLPLSMEVTDDLPLEFILPPALHASGIRRTHEFSYTTEASVRGGFRLRYIYIRYCGGLRLWAKQARLEAEQVIRVYPDLSSVRGIMSAMPDSLILDGKRLAKKERSGLEFNYIREYSADDDPRAINWTASARAGRPMTNVRQPEKGKILTVLIDCGRLMGMELDGKVKLDRAVEAALCLAAVALKQGDQVAVLVFSGDVKAYVPPGKGPGYLQDILAVVHDIHSDAAESNYGRALEHLMKVQRKRSMIVLFSDMENYLFEDELAPYLIMLRRSRPVMLLSLEDPLVTGWTRSKPISLQAAYTRSAAQSFRMDRKRFVAKMAATGIPVLDVPAGQLALAAVNRYLDLWSRQSM
jgi:uncharacterized protein (DUF58 family)